jgi:hypothetical protein
MPVRNESMMVPVSSCFDVNASATSGRLPLGRQSNPEPARLRAARPASWPWMLAIIVLFPCLAGAAKEQTPLPGAGYQQAGNLALGIGFGFVSFDSKFKVTSKETGGRRFLDLEGNLDLPEIDRVDIVYGVYDFNDRHSLVFNYFSIKRKSVLQGFGANFDDIVLLRATVEVEDKSSFFNLGYGYNLFRDDRSSITAVAGLNFLDLRLETSASGKLTVDGVTTSQVQIAEADVLAPMPLIGVNFGFDFTPKWGISTQIAFVDGTYQGTSATVWQTSVNSVYQLAPHTGILFGITHFETRVEIDEKDEISNVQYGYSGLFLGLHLSL